MKNVRRLANRLNRQSELGGSKPTPVCLRQPVMGLQAACFHSTQQPSRPCTIRYRGTRLAALPKFPPSPPRQSRPLVGSAAQKLAEKKKEPLEAGATDRVLPPHPPNPIRGRNSKAAPTSFVLVPSPKPLVACVVVPRPSVALAGRYCLEESGRTCL